MEAGGEADKTAVSPSLCISNKRRARPRLGSIKGYRGCPRRACGTYKGAVREPPCEWRFCNTKSSESCKGSARFLKGLCFDGAVRAFNDRPVFSNVRFFSSDFAMRYKITNILPRRDF